MTQVSSLCAKWAPTPKQAYDKKTLIATAIAELLYPEAKFRQPGMRASEYTEIARRSYAKEYLKPLREAACIPEVLSVPLSVTRVTPMRKSLPFGYACTSVVPLDEPATIWSRHIAIK